MRHVLAILFDPAALFGGAGFFATVSAQDLAAVGVAAVTILSLIPVVIVRWRKMLRGQDPESKPPFST